MGSRVALLSGGKDSLYAAMKYWPPDYGLVLVYESPIPSPHIVNLGKTIESILLTGVNIIVARLPRGREFEETVKLLQRLEAGELVAGDVYIEDHLKYMERVASEAGAALREPLWGLDPRELVYEILGSGFKVAVSGVKTDILPWLGKTISSANVDSFVKDLSEKKLDPLGEKGEYHTLVLDSPVHQTPLPQPRILEISSVDDYWIAKLV